MNSETEAFPPTMPNLDSPQLFSADLNNSMQDTDLFLNSTLSAESPAPLFGIDGFTSSPYQSPMPMKSQKQQTIANMAPHPHASSASPDSSMQDSSSDSSGRHKRKSSSRSSNAELRGGDVTMTEEYGLWKGNTKASLPEHEAFNMPTSLGSYQQFDYSNRQLENDFFDFESAASSPSPVATTHNHTYNGPRHIAIPFRDSPTSAPTFLPQTRSSMTTRDASPLSSMITGEFQHPPPPNSEPSPASSNEEYIDGAMLNSMQQLSTWPYNNASLQGVYPANTLIPSTEQPLHVGTPAVQATPITSGRSPAQPVLMIHPTPHKSRVETQIPIKLTLFPMPQGVTKLHLPPHTISKPKLLAKPPPAKSAEILELHTMLVCTSAMQDPVKLRNAFARAAQTSAEVKKEEGRRLSSGDAETAIEEDDQPLNGGAVQICVGCITRERKRAARKKSKKPEEEEPWQKDEAKRIIVFNTGEVKEWQSPSHTHAGSGGADASLENMVGYERPSQRFPEHAKQVDAPMRIACYCRHQNEKLGFQVIFTIKDHQDNLIAQAMTNPIVITDDHKTHATPLAHPSGSIFVDRAQMPGGSMFGRERLANYGAGMYRNAHSTTDLQGLQQSFNQNMTTAPMNAFANPLNSSHTTSTTLTPRNMSRQASPSGLSGPLHKKRKASGSGRLPDGLTMTRLQTASHANIPNQSWTSAGSSNPVSPAIASPFVPTFPSSNNPQNRHYPQHASQRSGQFFSGPPTPNSNDQGLLTGSHRTQSLENLAAVQQLFSAPNSAHPSRAPSPSSGAQNATFSTYGVSTASSYVANSSLNQQRRPTIHKLIPNEGTKAGGIEVTCLGSGFHQGLEVMFGDSLATTTTYWGETSLVCLLPPAVRAGTVVVTFKHQYQQQIQSARYPSPPVPKQQVLFKYVDDDEQELLRHALLLVHQKMTGMIEDAGDIARRIINAQAGNGQGPWSGASSQGSEQQRHVSQLQACLSTMDIEATVLKCIDLIDLDDSPFQAQLNLRRSNGQSMLHLCSSLGYHRLVAGLLARGANPDLRDRNGMSPMHMAALNGHTQIVKRLRLAGGDPMLRSLAGFMPSDMASSQSVLEAVQALYHSRSRSTGASSASLHSCGSSMTSLKSLWEPTPAMAQLTIEDSSSDEDGDNTERNSNRSRSRRVHTPAQHWARSRRNSAVNEANLMSELVTTARQAEAPGLLSPAAAMAVWRDNLAAQIQYFQQSVNWRTFPNLPMLQLPNLPPMPNLPDYQDSMVRRFSSLVPQRTSRPSTSSGGNSPDNKESDYRWWELLTGTAASPPPYEEIYPAKTPGELDAKKASLLLAATDAAADEKCTTNFDIQEGSSSMGLLQLRGSSVSRQELRLAHARKVKRLRSDRNLFFIWIPLLLFVVIATLTDRLPQVWHAGKEAYSFIHTRYQQRAIATL